MRLCIYTRYRSINTNVCVYIYIYLFTYVCICIYICTIILLCHYSSTSKALSLAIWLALCRRLPMRDRPYGRERYPSVVRMERGCQIRQDPKKKRWERGSAGTGASTFCFACFRFKDKVEAIQAFPKNLAKWVSTGNHPSFTEGQKRFSPQGVYGTVSFSWIGKPL